MTKFLNRLLGFILILTLSLSLVTYGEDSKVNEIKTKLSSDEAIEYLDSVLSYVESFYPFEYERNTLYENALKNMLKKDPNLLGDVLKGVLKSLDKHSDYFTPQELELFLSSTNPEFCGIGVSVSKTDAGLLITKVYDNSPAKNAGLLSGDIIIGADNINIIGMDISVAQSYILGEENTPIDIIFVRNGETKTVTIYRQKIAIDPGFYQMLENNTIGYIGLEMFDKQSDDLTKSALNEFSKNNIEDIILDLRGNPGGELDSLVDMCSVFIPKGVCINLSYKNPLYNYSRYTDGTNTDKFNIIILCDKNSASASEAFCAAMKDYERALIIGATTYGKGTMQNLISLSIGGALKLTHAEFLSPRGNKINSVGVEPHIFSEDKFVKYEKANYEPMTYDRKLKLGDKGKDVLAIEQRLTAIGYSIGVPDEVFDIQTYNATLSFQKYTSLYPYGVMDITTQLKLDMLLDGEEVFVDNALKDAIGVFKDGMFKKNLTKAY